MVWGEQADLMHHSHGATLGIHSALLVPGILVLGGHLRLVEAGVQAGDDDTAVLELLRQQHARHVGRSLAHVVPVVMPLRVLRRAPRDGAALRGDHRHLAALFQLAGIEQRRCHPERTHRADVDHLQLLIKVEGVNLLHRLVKVACIVDYHVQGLAHLRAQLGTCVSGGDINAGNNLHARDRIQLVAALAAGGDHLCALLGAFFDEVETDAAVAAGDQHARALQVAGLIHLGNVQHAGTVLRHRRRVARLLVGVAVGGHHGGGGAAAAERRRAAGGTARAGDRQRGGCKREEGLGSVSAAERGAQRTG
mmetsp:Transcript_32740/g.83647  ORF Transcript_32740/g.83647 Transcript_32740/m.83647 type:complete len:308 (-) Transcript_32740:122-1045(-)